ncbi:MAG TPA: UDP-N-acetylglucosamine 1-carboxyvinyltransferase [Firmicutes bacterium]|nr:UDP-N-acetylglucosamine 1-carboxyvinyltransferase [Bacillota bacterium]
MEKFIVEGKNRLKGELCVHGAKNSALPILAASLVCGDISVIHNCPKLSDVDVAIEILEYLGCQVKREENTIVVDSSQVNCCNVPHELMRRMRSSIIFLGAILSRCRQTTISYPGGCELGPRPIDLHLDGLRQLGVSIAEEHGDLECSAKEPLRGTFISLSFPSVGATENLMIAACFAKGTTTISNAAQEPEIVDLAGYLNKCGAKICRAGESTIYIEGVNKLHGCEYTVIPDRIETATFLVAAAATRGDVYLKCVNPGHVHALIPILKESGCTVLTGENSIYLRNDDRLSSVRAVRTMPYPGFPTDMQAPLMAALSCAEGSTVFVENIFENRFKHVEQLRRMGAKISVEGKVAIVEGVEQLHGAKVECTDLRGGASLLVAALMAQGNSQIEEIHHVDRGYEHIEESLRQLGAKVRREK